MGNMIVTRAVAATDIAAARELVKQASPSAIQSLLARATAAATTAAAVSSTSSPAEISSQLLQARRYYANFLQNPEVIRTPIPASVVESMSMSTANFMSSFSASSASASTVVSEGLFSILATQLLRVMNSLTGATQQIVKFIMTHKNIIAGGAVGITVVAAGVAFLTLRRDSIASATQSPSSPSSVPQVTPSSSATAAAGGFGGVDTSLTSNPETIATTSFTASSSSSPPDFLCDPISMDLFENPITVKSGHTFEHASLLVWLQDHTTCPLTRIQLIDTPGDFSSLQTTRNFAIEGAIEEYKKAVFARSL